MTEVPVPRGGARAVAAAFPPAGHLATRSCGRPATPRWWIRRCVEIAGRRVVVWLFHSRRDVVLRSSPLAGSLFYFPPQSLTLFRPRDTASMPSTETPGPRRACQHSERTHHKLHMVWPVLSSRQPRTRSMNLPTKLGCRWGSRLAWFASLSRATIYTAPTEERSTTGSTGSS